MKKLLSVVLAFTLLVSLGACGAAPASSSAPAPSAASSEAAAPASSAAAPEAAAPAGSDYPSKPVNVVVGWKAGGGSDMISRAVGNYFKNYSGGQPMLITNIEGGAGVQGISEYMTYSMDGYDILSWGSAQTIKAHMQAVNYDTVNDFIALGSFTLDSPYLLVQKDSPFQTINDLIDYAKANPGKVTMANAGTGGGIHLAALQFTLAAGIEINHVAYEGGAGAVQGLLTGEVDCSMNMPPEGLANIESGDLRILSIFSRERSPFFPDAPTALESGLDAVNEQARGFVIGKDAPQEAIDRLEEIFEQISKDPEFQKAVADMSMNAHYLDGAGYAKALQEEDELYKGIIQSNKLGDLYK